MRGVVGGLGTRQDSLSTGEPAKKFTDKDGLFPTPIGESFRVDLAKTDFIDPTVDADTPCPAEHRIVCVGSCNGVFCIGVGGCGTATKDVTLEDSQEDEHGTGLGLAGAGLADGGGDGETGADEGFKDGEEKGGGEVGWVAEGEGEGEGSEEGVEGREEGGDEGARRERGHRATRCPRLCRRRRRRRWRECVAVQRM